MIHLLHESEAMVGQARTSARARPVQRASCARRGVAMLLVIVSLAFATVLAMSYLASRDNSAMIGDNVVKAAKARWAAETAIDMSLAVLQTETNWRGEHTNGLLFSDLVIDNARVDARLTDMLTGSPPDQETEYIQVHAIADVDGLRRSALLRAFVPKGSPGMIDVDLSEFAIFMGQSASIEDDAIISRWEAAPLASEKDRLFIATTSTNGMSVNIGPSSSIIDATLYTAPLSSSILLANSSEYMVPLVETNETIPFLPPPDPGTTPTDTTEINAVKDQASNTIGSDRRFESLELRNDSWMRLRGPTTIVIDEDLHITTGSRLVFDEQVRLIIFGDLIVEDGSMELESDTSSATVFVGGDILMDHAYVGPYRWGSSISMRTLQHDNSADSKWSDPSRIAFYGIAPSLLATSPQWRFTDNAVAKAMFYSPWHDVQVGLDSAIFGRVAAKSLRMTNNAGLYYPPTENSKRGYTNPYSGVYNADGTLNGIVLGLTSLQGDADDDGLDDVLEDVSSEDAGEDGSGTTGITPRPVPVEIYSIVIGNESDELIRPDGPATSAPITTIDKMHALVRDLAAAPLNAFIGVDASAKADQQTKLHDMAVQVIDDYRAGNVGAAIGTLENLRSRVDGVAAIEDWMITGVHQSEIRARATEILGGM